MGLAMLYYIALGHSVHLVSMNSGGALGVAYTLNGVNSATGVAVACSTPGDHPYIHSPEREGYEPHTAESIGAARILEARTALGMMAMVPPVTPGAGGTVTHHIGGLPDFYGNPGSTSSTAPVTPEGIASAKAVILPFVQDNPNSFHYTMSPADHHPDHAACGLALREIKTENPTLLGTPRFFISRLYWTITNGLYAADLRAAAGGTPADPNGSIDWFDYAGSHYTTYANWLKNQVQDVYRAWNPAGGSFGIGYHQVSSQFNNNFGPTASVANLWHA